MKSHTLLFALVAPLTLAGCGSQPQCTTEYVANAYPQTATADHLARSPGNQEVFSVSAAAQSSSPGCAIPALSLKVEPTWVSSNPNAVQISSAADETNGTATCLTATTAPVTLTATNFGAGITPTTLTVSLSCK